MNVVRVRTNETCNMNCAFCTERRAAEVPSFVQPRAVRQRIALAARSGAREIVLTGGEPTLRRDLPALVAFAKPLGARVVLETNGALVDDAVAEALARAGLDCARVHVPRWGDECDVVTRDEGGFQATRAGLAALARAGVALEIAAPVVRDTIAALPDLPAEIARSALPVRALVLGVPVRSPDPRALVSLNEAGRAIEAAEQASRDVGLIVRLDTAAAIPPCFLPHPARVAHLFALTPGGAARPDHAKLDACAACVVADRCPGVPIAALEREPELAVRPITEDRTRRRLSMVSSVEDQIARELVTRDVRRQPDGSTIRENIVRINFQCNQVCRFCFVSTHLPSASDAAIEAAIVEIAHLGGVLTLSGGEPTLNPRLVEWVRLGKREGASEVELQTNAVRLGDPGLARALADAGVDVAFVSLHAATAAISDEITGAPGTFEKTLRGIDELAKTSIALRLNFVFCEANLREFPAYVAMVAARWPGAKVTVSFVAASTDLVPRERSLVPRYSDVMPFLAEGVRAAKRLGVELTGFESMCGVPLCQIPDDVSAYFSLAEAPPASGELVKPAVCGACALERQCFGLRRGYAHLYGTSELRPIPRAEAAAPDPGAR